MKNTLIETRQEGGKFVPAAPSRVRRIAAKALGTAGAIGGVLLSSSAMALSTEQNGLITAAYDATGVSTNLIIAGLLGVVLLITGFSIIYGLLKR